MTPRVLLSLSLLLSLAPLSAVHAADRASERSNDPCSPKLVKTRPQLITYQDGKPVVPDHPILAYIEGDGIGPEVWNATRKVLDAAVLKAYGGMRKIEWRETLAGLKAKEKTGEYLPEATLRDLKTYGVGIKGPLYTPTGGGFRSINVTLRQELDHYSCVRPVVYFQNVPSPVKNPEAVNVVIFRENTEDVYAGVEFAAGTAAARRLNRAVNEELKRADSELPPVKIGGAIGVKPMTKRATERHVRRAIRYAIENGFTTVTIVHKGNIQKTTEGAFRDWAYALALREFRDRIVTGEELARDHGWQLPHGKLLINDIIADNMFQQILLKPQKFGVLITPNLNGDYLSDAIAAQVGGLGIAPGANIGDRGALFEATHGTAPDIAGQNKANPTSLILSGAMMLKYLGWTEAEALIRDALSRTFSNRIVTGDFREMAGARIVGTREFGEQLVDAMSEAISERSDPSP